MGSLIPVTSMTPLEISSSVIRNERHMNQVENARCLQPNGHPVSAGGYIGRALYSNGAVLDLNQTEQWVHNSGDYYNEANVGMASRSQLINGSGSVAPHLVPVINTPSVNVNTVNGNSTEGASTQIGNSLADCMEFDLDDLLFSDQIPCSFSSLLRDGNSLYQGLQYGISASNGINLNSPPRREANEPIGASTFQLVPSTPDQASSIENGSALFVQETGLLEKRDTSSSQGITPNNLEKTIRNIDDFSVVDSTANEGHRHGSRQHDPVIDLNKTPQLKPPKRKKYMPKVVREKKPPKKARKPATPSNAKSKEARIGKRKYVKKATLKESALKEPDRGAEDCNPSTESSVKGCRRALNFDSEKTLDNCMNSVTQMDQSVVLLDSNRSAGVSAGEKQPVLSNGDQPVRLEVRDEQPWLLAGRQQFQFPIQNQPLGFSVGMHRSFFPMGNQQYVSFNKQNQQALLGTRSEHGRLSVGMQQPELLRAGHMKNQQHGLSVMNPQPENLSGFTSTFTQMLTSYIPSNGARGPSSLSQNSVTNSHADLLNTMSRSTSESTAQGNRTMEYNCLQKNIDERSRYIQSQRRCIDNVPPTPSILSKPFETRGRKRVYDYAVGERQNHDMNNVGCWSLLQQIVQSQDLVRRNSGSSLLEASKKAKIQNGFNASVEVIEIEDDCNDSVQKDIVNVSISETASKGKCRQIQRSANTEKCIMVPPTPPRTGPAAGNELVASLAHASEPNSLESIKDKTSSSRSKAKGRRKKSIKDSGQTKGTMLCQEPSGELQYQNFIIDIIQRLQNLDLGGKIRVQKEHNELVLFRGEGAVVPYEVKKRKSRPKVDLDEETTRIWNLLMGKGDSENNQDMDKEKEKWWEEERRVFRGRADSFIARMHLVQGDRRFSPWKGSVVDSVIGVFLTQNVTDHLSSSAFMSLAARFPPKSNTNVADERNRRVIVEDPDGCILNLNDIPEEQKDSSNSALERVCSLWNCSQTIDEEVLSSQDSFDPSLHQSRGGGGRVGSCSGFTSDAEFSTTMGEPKSISGSIKSIQIERPSLLDDIYCQENWRDSLSFCQPDSHINPYTRYQSHLMMNGMNTLEECLTRQSSITQNMTDPQSSENRLVESNASNQEQFTIEYKDINSKAVGKIKGKMDDGKKSTAHWDSLRKDVEGNGKVKERSKAFMDSIDYEAIRSANVSEISEAIKERGMNNMLAARIKEFLDRVVEDHGSIDLEWLRDVPPDRVKDYLLSIRGLGLKSVECVRLLTLHNLAFPVDTNVGRIAVRLGWVPLQPLPESLQLHLLEMYPVLESIQKYLWPRLCKLDQRTLYELHYQLITFGKVFCTKSRPNCNACPMRGECRHFASAFASARLALPAPDEKSLSNVTNPIPTIHIPTMELPPPENHMLREVAKGGNCEPIIEEPMTPEQDFTEVTESDIEDAYYQDPDEIPTIKLDIREFSATLQEYVGKNMELQGDMSRALVALDPSAASIPSQKLKNISRLRTEHQVYELPDSHPLLDGMDKREPDDPSPYLLAIWTPGETADSTQPPERKCEWKELGKLCSDKTCSACNGVREESSQKVRGTLLIPCRTAMRGSFPLNGTYFQVNEVFADHESSRNPIDVPRDWIWNLPRRTVYFGTSVTSIFRGLSTEQIQYCFWKGFVCVRGFDQKSRAPRPLMARLHFPASKLKAKTEAAK